MNKLIPLIALFSYGNILAETPLENLLSNPELKTASIGFSLIPLKGGLKPLSALHHNPDLALTPASVQKVITTATALQVLGPDYRFQTRLYRSGDDLIIRGGGDPLLATESPNSEFPAWHAALLKANITAIKGTLIADSSFFEENTTPNQWLWGDIGNYYGAGACGLNFHDNSYGLTFQPGIIGAPARLLSAYPRPPGVTFQNNIKTGASDSGDQAYAYSGPQSQLVTLRGTLPAGEQFLIGGSLPNPPLSCVSAFRDYLIKKNIPVNAIAIKKSYPKEENLLHTTTSIALAKLIASTNQESINLNAECLFKALTPDGTTTASQKKLLTHWRGKGVNLTGFLAHDGSGLAPQNTLTARQATDILKLTANGQHGSIFRASLPVSGRSGTLTRFGVGTAAEGRVTAKSGSLERVRTWAGYLKTKSGDNYAFALFINHYNGTDIAVQTAAANFLAALCAK